MLFRSSRKLLEDKATLAELWKPAGLAHDPTTIALVFGMWDQALMDHGEFEPVVALSYALMMGELRQFLQVHYDNVTLAKGEPPAGHEGPVVYLGGPVTIPAVAEVVDRSKVPYWFQGLPYGPDDKRSIGIPGVAYAPELGADQSLASDVGVAMRIAEDGRLSFVVAGCYGVGTLGSARFLMDPEHVRSLGDLLRAPRMEVVVRSVARGWDVEEVQLMTSTAW